jgi:hypothetical protein
MESLNLIVDICFNNTTRFTSHFLTVSPILLLGLVVAHLSYMHHNPALLSKVPNHPLRFSKHPILYQCSPQIAAWPNLGKTKANLEQWRLASKLYTFNHWTTANWSHTNFKRNQYITKIYANLKRNRYTKKTYHRWFQEVFWHRTLFLPLALTKSRNIFSFEICYYY